MASQVAATAALITEQHALLSRTRGGRLTVQTGFAVVGQASVARVACVLFVGFDEVGQVACVAILAVAVPIVSLLGHVRSDSPQDVSSTRKYGCELVRIQPFRQRTEGGPVRPKQTT